jgi:hypothetical protein
MRRRERSDPGSGRWLVLVHQLPTKPDYLRVKVGRDLRRLGALPLKNTVYVLPDSGAHRNDLQALARAILERGGEAAVLQSRFAAGLSDRSIEDRFRRARDLEYGRIATAARRIAESLRGKRSPALARRRALGRALDRLETQLAEIAVRDWFGAGGKDPAMRLLSLARDLLQGVEAGAPPVPGPLQPPRGALWVTRTGVMVDRIASAWLIRRFIDREARFRFAPGHGYKPRPGEIRFDMAEAEFTHERGLCTFEVLLERFSLRDSALASLGEMVHDLDLEDARHQRPETAGLGRMIVGIALASPDDEVRLARGATVLDSLYESFRSTVSAAGAPTPKRRTTR